MKGMDLRGVALHGVEVETMWTNEFPFRCRVESLGAFFLGGKHYGHPPQMKNGV